MLLLELAAQSVRGFSPSVRAAVKPGYVGLKSPTELPAPLVGLILALCYPDGRGGDASFLAAGAKIGRAGLSIQASDGGIWRLVRDLGGSGGLHKLDRATKQYSVVTQESDELGQLMRSAVGFPARATFEQLFTFTGVQLPTRRPKAPKLPPQASGAGKRKVQSSAYDQYGGAEATVEPEERLAQLEKELLAAKHAAEMQFRMDGVQAEIFQSESRLKGYDDLRAKADAARAELEKAPSPKGLGLPDDIVDRVKRFNDDKKKHGVALLRLQTEKADAIDERALSVDPLYRDRQFWALLALGFALLIAPAFMEGAGRFLSLLSIPAFTLVTLLSLRFIEALQHASREAAKGEVFSGREKKLQDEFQLANLTIQTAFEKTSAATDDEFFAVMATREQLAPQVEQLQGQLAALESDGGLAELPKKLAELRAEHEALNDKLLAMSGGYVREVREVERDIFKIKEQLAPPPAPVEEFRAVTTTVETFDDPMPSVMLLGCDLFSTDVPTLWNVLKDRSAQYLKALTDQRYHGIELDSDGKASLLAPGRTVAATELPGKDLDLLYLSIRLTLVEKYSAQAKLPVIIEDTFGTVIDLTKQGLLGRMLKHLGSLTQVLHVTGRSQNVSSADDIIQI